MKSPSTIDELHALFTQYQSEAEQNIADAFRKANMVKLKKVYDAGFAAGYAAARAELGFK